MSAERLYRRRYRKVRFGFYCEIICLRGSWVDRFMGEAPPAYRADFTWRPTEKSARRWCARRLWRLTRPKDWKVA